MRKLLAAFGLALLLALPPGASATPEQDLAEFRAFCAERFPNTPFDEFVNGVYSIDPESRAQWEDRGIPALRAQHQPGRGNVRHAIRQRQVLRRLLS